MRAKQEKTKLSRLNNAIAESQQGRRLKWSLEIIGQLVLKQIK
jgi:hypothetical protein